VGGAGFPVSQPSHRSEEPSSEACSLPPETAPLTSLHKKYLLKRNFDPDRLVEDWNIAGTNHQGDYRFRIIIPIYLYGELISFQSRDITGVSVLRYKACPVKKTILSHKNILYGIDEAKEKRVIVVEGIFDVWRLNANNPGASVSTFGTKVTDKQVLLLIERFDEINILFDSQEKDKDALTNAQDLADKVTALGKEAHVYNLIKGDPADLSQEEADDIVKQILGGNQWEDQ
jgi:DNA primase